MRLFPRTDLDAHPVIGGMKVVVLLGSAATFAVLCPAGAVLFDCVGLFMAPRVNGSWPAPYGPASLSLAPSRRAWADLVGVLVAVLL